MFCQCVRLNVLTSRNGYECFNTYERSDSFFFPHYVRKWGPTFSVYRTPFETLPSSLNSKTFSYILGYNLILEDRIIIMVFIIVEYNIFVIFFLIYKFYIE